MAHNYAADSTFQDVMARLAGTDAPFSAVWPTLKGAILSGRALTAAEYRPLNALIREAHATRIARNEALNAPRMHSTVGEVANSVGAPEDTSSPTEGTTSSVSGTAISESHLDKVQEDAKAAAATATPDKPTAATAAATPDKPTAADASDDQKNEATETSSKEG
ncbi:hypothetical protein [Komagataeibacter medellinensis]|uniref:Uncharacterized protein n=1 Tax=Komagataeibacter medellinensis (strain NBRC 3288 / BCRC 11682 / LMG 1693 / Kondo 51) TaxID=634177 RepID=G2I0S1_KOMMN|nr:hypothetical protein [Komagataeibacter medellinensis]BAK84529.1 hypothetical protein GLX_21170 [Komagataeibacter medellinensis NBRC 3288]